MKEGMTNKWFIIEEEHNVDMGSGKQIVSHPLRRM